MQATFSRLYICNTACISPIYVHSKWISCGLGIQSFNASLSVADKSCTIYMMILQYSTSILSDIKEGRRGSSVGHCFLRHMTRLFVIVHYFLRGSTGLVVVACWEEDCERSYEIQEHLRRPSASTSSSRTCSRTGG